MPRYIVKINNQYLEWSTIVDAPVTFGMSLDEFKEYYSDEYGEAGMNGLSERLKRVEEKGVSSYLDGSVSSLVSFNRAGPKETHLPLRLIKKAFCDRIPVVDKGHKWDLMEGGWKESWQGVSTTPV